MENYELNKTARLFPVFIDNLSNWYVRRSRKRFWKSENDGDKNQAYETLHYVLAELSKLMAPFTPFVAEEIYKNLTGKESVHLADFPAADEKLIDEDLNEKMQLARRFVKLGLAARAKAGIKVRQPLSELKINEDVGKELGELIKEEVNVKKSRFCGGNRRRAGLCARRRDQLGSGSRHENHGRIAAGRRSARTRAPHPGAPETCRI